MKKILATILMLLCAMVFIFSGCAKEEEIPLDPIVPDKVWICFSQFDKKRTGEIVRPYSTVRFSLEDRGSSSSSSAAPVELRCMYQGVEKILSSCFFYHEYNPDDFILNPYFPYSFDSYSTGWPTEPGQYEVILGTEGDNVFWGFMTYIIAVIE